MKLYMHAVKDHMTDKFRKVIKAGREGKDGDKVGHSLELWEDHQREIKERLGDSTRSLCKEKSRDQRQSRQHGADVVPIISA
ncbi:hypothetical protein ACLOJK_033025 [Asimina triloba]